MNRFGLIRLPVVASALFTANLLLSGCTKPISTEKGSSATELPKVDPWVAVSRDLRRESSLAACKAALGQLNSDLAQQADGVGPPPLSDSAAQLLRGFVPLSDPDLVELRSTSYSGLDTAYLADCFYFRDAARSLDTAGLPPIEQARIAFAWVCRQVVLQPWVVGGVYIPAVPPTYTLRRGDGSGLERAYVFLHLLQQMRLDGCLVGGPGCDAKPTSVTEFNGKDGKEVPRGPFWAVGVRIGPDVFLFDPWRGEPLPGPGGKSIGTLAQIKSDTAQLKPWFDDKANTWPVTAEDAKRATAVLAVPLSALAPRMEILDRKIHADTGVRLAIDASALRERFAAPAPKGPGLTGIKFWNPPDDQFTFTRSLIDFLTPEEGGHDSPEPTRSLQALFRRMMLPREVLNVPDKLNATVVGRLQVIIATQYSAAFFAQPSPRERIQRGQYQDAARDLSEKLQTFGRGQERLRSLAPGDIDEWTRAVNEVYDNLEQSRYPNKGQLTPQPDSDPAVAEARAAVDFFWRQNRTSQAIVDRAIASIGVVEASFLMALVKHEQAERKQVRAEHAAAGDAPETRQAATAAWREASHAWTTFLEQSASGSPRTNHAQKLAARAQKLADAR